MTTTTTTPSPIVDTLAKRLGMTDANVAAFRAGKVVTEERDSSNDKDLCLLVAVLLPSTLERTWDFVTAERVQECQEANLAQGVIDVKTFALEGFEFAHGTAANLTKYNLSKAETKTLHSARNKEATFLQILSARAKSYWEKGIKGGIESYEGKNHDVSHDLEIANQNILQIVRDPTIRQELTVVPAQSTLPDCHSLVWSIVQGNSMTSIVLSHRILYKRADGDGFVAVTRKYYSGADFDASMITTGVLRSADDKSAVFYLNHTYSPAVAGFGGGAKRSIGRKMMKGALVETMEKAKTALA